MTVISQTAEYALRAILFMAEHPETSHTTQEVAEATQVPAGYLSKVLQSLHRGGLVSSQRGLGGGFSLTKPASEITVYEIVQAVDPIQRIRSCPLKLEAHAECLCHLHQRLDDAIAHVEKSFRETNVGELIASRGLPARVYTFPYHEPSPAAAGR
ncbi:MAG TPA: Rrf2 family transcriptional regulator [Planctomycetota bacterium]|jgi:Rrf2 family protein